MSERSETPDRMARFNRKDRFDSTTQGVGKGRNNASQIVDNKLGPKCHLDEASSRSLTGAKLDAGSESVKDAGNSIPSGAKAPCVDWNHLKRA